MTMKKIPATLIPKNRQLSDLFTPKQISVLEHYFNKDFFMMILHGAKRSGKTYINNLVFLCEVMAIRERATAAGVRHPQMILAGATLGSLEKNVIIEIENYYHVSIKLDKYNRFMLFGVLVCCFGHATSMDLARIRGMTAWGAYINEASMANENVFNEIRTRCSAPGSRIICDTNPDRPSHWLKRKYIDEAVNKPDTICQFHFKLADNTFLKPREIKNIIDSSPSGMFYERDVNGAWVAAEGLVYPDFRRDVHYISADDVPEISRYFAGMDFGWEHPGAISLFGEDYGGTIYLLKEWSSKHRNIDEWISIIRDDVEPATGPIIVYCDSARPDLINDMQCAGVDARNAHKDVVAGIGEVATLFKQRRLLVVRENVDLFDEEIDAYAWREGRDEPVKLNDDVMDSMRYGVYSDRVEREEECTVNTGRHLRGGY